jgi:L-threonylcarbamoyladenylate synthase
VTNIDHTEIAKAAAYLREGRLVAFPTETVYGLGSDALNVAAVGKIFSAKGRPATNPLIVHVRSLDHALPLVTSLPAAARALANAFWPGPLTLVMPKSKAVPAIVTAGGPTVAIRVPHHPIALLLLSAFDGPIAAPSANRANHLSPTCAQHVAGEHFDDLAMILDGGACEAGLESTVLDITGDTPTILRPGPVLPSQLAAVVGNVRLGAGVDAIARSPGLGAKHYSPRTPLELCVDIRARVQQLDGMRIALVSHSALSVEGATAFAAPADARGYAAGLYELLHRIDSQGFDAILVEQPPEDEAWLASRDRLARASAR